MTPLDKGQLLTDDEYLDAVELHGDDLSPKWAPKRFMIY